jgi:hypothetical protein
LAKSFGISPPFITSDTFTLLAMWSKSKYKKVAAHVGLGRVTSPHYIGFGGG